MTAVKSLTGSIPRIEYVLGLLVALVVSDGIVTDFLISNGYGREGNPFLQAAIGNGNLLLVKMTGALLGAMLLWQIYKRRPQLVMIVSLLFVGLYTGIVYWNIGVLFISQG